MPPKSAQAISTSQNHSHVLTKIPFIQRIVEYSASDDVRRIFTLAQVTPSWRETVEHYNGTAFRFLKLSCFKYDSEYPNYIGSRCYVLFWRCVYHGTCFWMFETMIRAGIRVNKVMECVLGGLFTALILATFGNQKKCVELLLKADADRMGETSAATTALQVACREGRLEILELLLQQDREKQLNHRCTGGDTCFHFAAFNGHEAVLRRLLELCPELVSVTNNFGDTPLDVACKRNRLGAAKLLFAFLGDDAKFRNQTYFGNPPHRNTLGSFLVACVDGHLDIVEFLVKEKKVDLRSPVPAHHENALTLSVRSSSRNRVAIAKILIEGGCDTKVVEERLSAKAVAKLRDPSITAILELIKANKNRTSKTSGAKKK